MVWPFIRGRSNFFLKIFTFCLTSENIVLSLQQKLKTQKVMKNSALTPEMIQIINNRINLMLSNPQINAIYQSFNTKEAAERYIFAAACATLIGAFN